MVSVKIKNTKCAHSNCSFNFFFFLCFFLVRLLLCTCGDIIDVFPDFYCISVVLDQKQTFFITLVFRLNILVVFTATISGSSFRVSIYSRLDLISAVWESVWFALKTASNEGSLLFIIRQKHISFVEFLTFIRINASLLNNAGYLSCLLNVTTQLGSWN